MLFLSYDEGSKSTTRVMQSLDIVRSMIVINDD